MRIPERKRKIDGWARYPVPPVRDFAIWGLGFTISELVFAFAVLGSELSGCSAPPQGPSRTCPMVPPMPAKKLSFL